MSESDDTCPVCKQPARAAIDVAPKSEPTLRDDYVVCKVPDGGRETWYVHKREGVTHTSVVKRERDRKRRSTLQELLTGGGE